MSEPLKGGFASFTAGNAFKLPEANQNSSQANPPPSLFGTGAGNATGGSTGAFGGTGGGGLFGNLGTKPTGGGLFGSGGVGGAPAAPTNNLFGGFGAQAGNTQNSNTAPAANVGGGTTSAPAFNLFGAAQPGAQPPATGAPAAQSGGGSLGGFGASSTTPGSGVPQPPSLFGGSAPPNFFSNPPKPSDATNTTGTAAPTVPSTTNLFANFGKKPDAPAAGAAPPATTATSVPSLFGNLGGPLGAKKDDDASKDKPPAASGPGGGLFGQPATDKAAAPTPAFSLFGAKPPEQSAAPAPSAPKEGEKKDAAPTSSLPAFSLGGTAANQAAAGPSSTAPAASSASISVPPPSMLRGKTIEEIVNKWSSELETHVREFQGLAGEVAVWDRALIDNGNTIAALFQHVLLAEREQNDIEQSLQHVEDQQKELAATLEVYEKAAGDIFDGQGGGLRALDVGPADAERDKHYTLAADLNTQLDDLSRSLTQMIESVNSLTDSADNEGANGSSKPDAPLDQIAQILSSHLESLQWIDGAVREVETKVTDVERRVRDASSAGSSSSSVAGGSINGHGLPRPRGFGVR